MHWLWWLQVLADILLIGAVVVLLARLGRGSRPAAGIKGPDLEEFVSEASRLSAEFDRLLGEKRELVAGTLASLDRRIEELKSLAAELERAGASQPAPTGDAPDFKQKVAELAAAGKDPAAIAAATGRPRGEVELALGLSGRKTSAR